MVVIDILGQLVPVDRRLQRAAGPGRSRADPERGAVTAIDGRPLAASGGVSTVAAEASTSGRPIGRPDNRKRPR